MSKATRVFPVEPLSELIARREEILQQMASMPAAGNHTWAVLARQCDALDVAIARRSHNSEPH